MDRLERVLKRAERRLLRRKGKAESVWTMHVARTGHQPSLWHRPYERLYELENEAELLCLALARLRERS